MSKQFKATLYFSQDIKVTLYLSQYFKAPLYFSKHFKTTLYLSSKLKAMLNNFNLLTKKKLESRTININSLNRHVGGFKNFYYPSPMTAFCFQKINSYYYI